MTWFVIGLIPFIALFVAMAIADIKTFVLVISFGATIMGGLWLTLYGAEQMGWLS